MGASRRPALMALMLMSGLGLTTVDDPQAAPQGLGGDLRGPEPMS